jgi:hypothetical protein
MRLQDKIEYYAFQRNTMMKGMVLLLVLFIAISCLYDQVITVSVFLLSVLAFVLCRKVFLLMEQDKIKAAYYSQLEHIIEASQSPDDNTVYKRAQQHRAGLKEAGNPYGVKVYEIIFKEGAYVTETWDEFTARRDSTTREIITERHRVLRNKSRSLYLRHLAGQMIE